MHKKYLVVVRAGDASLHPEWLSGNRNRDLVVSYYGGDRDRHKMSGVPRFDRKGSKWEGLYRLLISGDRLGEYRYLDMHQVIGAALVALEKSIKI